MIDHSSQIFISGFSILDKINIQSTKFRHDFCKSFVIKFKADETFDYQGLEKQIYKAVSSNGINIKSMVLIPKFGIQTNNINFDPGQRVFSGLSAILDYEIINFREYDCSMDTTLPNCQVVELFLTVDTSRKLQNGVNIDISIDRLELSNFLLEL